MLDFHALRHTCGAWLAMGGADPKAVQAVMRNSAISLTMDTYGHLFAGQEADTVARLPEMLTDPLEAPRATGTADATPAAKGWAQNGAQLNGKTCAPLASGGENTTARSGEPDCRKPLPASIFGNPRRAVAAADEARPAGLEPATCGLEVYRASYHPLPPTMRVPRETPKNKALSRLQLGAASGQRSGLVEC